MNRRTRVQTLILGLVIGLLTTVALAAGHGKVGYVRDEGIYFEASRQYSKWVATAVSDPGRAMQRKVRDEHFKVNAEHPPLMKLAGGMSARLLARPRQDIPSGAAGTFAVMDEGAAMRLPAQILVGLGVALLFWVGASWAGLGGGLIAAGTFILLPRVAFHAGLHAFDVPIAVATLIVALWYRRALRSARFGWTIGIVLGLAVAIKHNALFLAPLLFLHYACCVAWQRFRNGRQIRVGQWIPLPFWSMAIAAPLTVCAVWPWLWGDPVGRVRAYFAFHREHAYYNMEFLGQNYNLPPMPMSYPWVMTWATVPTVVLVLWLVGLLIAWRRDLTSTGDAARTARPGGFLIPLPGGHDGLDAVWLTILGLFPIALISLPSIPIFGGTKHWLTAYPFLALAGAVGFGALWKAADLAPKWHRLAPAAALAVTVPALWATLHGHPYNLSQYAALAGGARGAASLGLNRGFWGHAAVALLPTIGEEIEAGKRIYLHDIHPLCHQQYLREGRWPARIDPAPIDRAQGGLLFYEKHMATYEIQLWRRLATTAPTHLITMDDVPLSALYTYRREPREAPSGGDPSGPPPRNGR